MGGPPFINRLPCILNSDTVSGQRAGGNRYVCKERQLGKNQSTDGEEKANVGLVQTYQSEVVGESLQSHLIGPLF